MYAEVQSIGSGGKKKGWIKFSHLKLNVTNLLPRPKPPMPRLLSSSTGASSAVSGSGTASLADTASSASLSTVDVHRLDQFSPDLEADDADQPRVDAETESMMSSWSRNLVLTKRESFMSDRLHNSCLSLLDQVERDLYSPASSNSLFERKISGMDVLQPDDSPPSHGKRRMSGDPNGNDSPDRSRRRRNTGTSLGQWTRQTLLSRGGSKDDVKAINTMLQSDDSFLSLFTQGADLARLAVKAEKDACFYYDECTKFLSAALEKPDAHTDKAALQQRIGLYRARARGLHALQSGKSVLHAQQPPAMAHNQQMWKYRQQMWGARKHKLLTCDDSELRVAQRDGGQLPLTPEQRQAMVAFRRSQLSAGAGANVQPAPSMFKFDDTNYQLLCYSAAGEALPVTLSGPDIQTVPGEVPMVMDMQDPSLSARHRTNWNPQQNAALAGAVGLYGKANWSQVALAIPGRTPDQCRQHWNKTLEPQQNGRNTGRWSQAEKRTLKSIVEGFMASGVPKPQLDWHQIALALGTRDQKQCKEQYTKNLDPNLKAGDWSKEEDGQIWTLKAQGMGWEAIARRISVPGAVRTGDRVKKRHQALVRRKRKM